MGKAIETTTIRASRSNIFLLNEIKAMAERNNKTLNRYIVDILSKHLKKAKK